MNNYILANLDTDSIAISKSDMSLITEDEQKLMLESLNSIFPEGIRFMGDGYFSTFVVLKAKNYILYDGHKIKLKGSSLKSSTLEPVLKSMLNEMIEAIVFDRQSELSAIYIKYIKMVDNITDITPWLKKVTLSPVTFNSQRKNETKIIDAIKNTGHGSGDRVYLYSKNDGTLSLADNFDGNYDRKVLYQKLFNTTKRFETILPVKELFKNFTLKREQDALNAL